ncbi:uncharacterized protein LOC110708037 [Chenopodium quinoa]|uniref:uncharacterized protein LOC110708037 n=1 Tax=Chenopodium quinoa TaxID=63459 RepID=UPI000B76C09A|nr:uncharacterized protein LOC110708037 [Chenopodium quinoa]
MIVYAGIWRKMVSILSGQPIVLCLRMIGRMGRKLLLMLILFGSVFGIYRSSHVLKFLRGGPVRMRFLLATIFTIGSVTMTLIVASVNENFESTLHALRDCKFAREIWSKSQFSHVACSRMSTIIDWWESVFTEFDNDEVTSIITLCWAIWGARNSRIMEGKIIEPEDTVKYALKICQEVSEESCKLDVRPGRTAAVSHPETWSIPDQGWHKVDGDAGIIGELGSGLGAVIRDSSGVVCACSSFQAPDKWTTEVAEAKAVLFGLQLAGELGVQQIVLESDCLLVIQALRNKSTGSSSIHLVLDDIYAKSSNFVNVRWSFVKRGGNKIAHALAHSQPWEVGHRVWNDVIPTRILELALADLNE